MKFELTKKRVEYVSKKTQKTCYFYKFYLISDEGLAVEVSPVKFTKDGKVVRNNENELKLVATDFIEK